ncbi:formate/nitrite transporter family protein [Mesomycoplasma lagogenitalium]|uniref:Formate/nitrite transporter family protein n=1 Tax=Mesomycoplasma lagogenitalium TaxID=171286 RepID=A0ABY8LU53_9BACT|nr:formate/nitrite transporter family protein [Mesomycoplasma lagogenitalium]WGI36775.1 formate/nitrite transporter family protein [Mesomycoplasma lagogenitalium]
MQDYKSNFSNAIDYGYQKTKLVWWKHLLMGMMASIYVGIGYIGYIYVLGWFGADQVETNGHFYLAGNALFLAAMVFPVGIIMITILGGSLFTSDSLQSLAVMTKKARATKVLRNLFWVLVGNFLGGLFVAILLKLSHAFKDDQLRVLEFIISKKISYTWTEVFASALLCNILVAGTVWACLATNSTSGKILIMFFFIWVFAIAGFQHVVANGILFAFGWLFQNTEYTTFANDADFQEWIHEGLISAERVAEMKAENPVNNNSYYEFTTTLNEMIEINSRHKLPEYSSLNWTGKALLPNLLSAMVGNWFSGAIFLPVVYWALIKFKPKKYGTIDPQVIVENEIKQVLENQEVKDIDEAKEIAFSNLSQIRKKEIKKNFEKPTLLDKIKKFFSKNKK